MRAATIRDGQVVVAEHPDPQPGSGEVLVRVHAAGLNGADIHQRAGHYPAPPGSPPDIPGLELAGEVVARGPGAERFAEGDRVMAVVGGGGQAELATVHERQLMPVPEGVSWIEAGGLPEVFTTAHDALFTQAGLRAGERLLVHGAAGGVGTAGVQLGASTGAHVTATVRNESLRDEVAALGAHQVIDPEGFAEHGPFDVVLELVGAPNLAGDLQALATSGRIVVIGIGGGAKAELNLRRPDGQARDHPRLDPAPAPAGGEGPHRARDGAPRAAALRARRAARAGGRDLPAGRGRRGLRALHRRRQAGQDRAGACVNAAERLWRGLARHDWEAVRAQFHSVRRHRARRRRHAAGRRGVHRRAPRRGRRRGSEIEVLRSVVDGRAAVIEARVGDRRCAGIYDLHDGRIAGAIEYWAAARRA